MASTPLATATATATTAPTPGGTATPPPLPDGDDWAEFRSDVYGTGLNPETSITAANVAELAQVWRRNARRATSAHRPSSTASPT